MEQLNISNIIDRVLQSPTQSATNYPLAHQSPNQVYSNQYPYLYSGSTMSESIPSIYESIPTESISSISTSVPISIPPIWPSPPTSIASMINPKLYIVSDFRTKRVGAHAVIHIDYTLLEQWMKSITTDFNHDVNMFYDYLDYSTALQMICNHAKQYQYLQNRNQLIVIINYDLKDLNQNQLYGIIGVNIATESKCQWKLEGFMNATEILQQYAIHYEDLPPTSRVFSDKLDKISRNIEMSDIDNVNWMELLLIKNDSTKATHTGITITQNVLAEYCKSELQKVDQKLIPILVVVKNHMKYRIDGVLMVNIIHKNCDIGIGFTYNNQTDKFDATSVYLDKTEIEKKHKLIGLKQNYCKCLRNFSIKKFKIKPHLNNNHSNDINEEGDCSIVDMEKERLRIEISKQKDQIQQLQSHTKYRMQIKHGASTQQQKKKTGKNDENSEDEKKQNKSNAMPTLQFLPIQQILSQPPIAPLYPQPNPPKAMFPPLFYPLGMPTQPAQYSKTYSTNQSYSQTRRLPTYSTYLNRRTASAPQNIITNLNIQSAKYPKNTPYAIIHKQKKSIKIYPLTPQPTNSRKVSQQNRSKSKTNYKKKLATKNRLITPYDPNPKHRAKKNIKISNELTEQIIPSVIKENIFNIYDYMDKTTAMQIDNEFNNGKIRIINYDFHCKKTNKILYAVIKLSDKKSQKSRCKWQMEEKLYTADELFALEVTDECKINESMLPKSSRMNDQYQCQLNHGKKVENILKNKQKRDKIMNQTKWQKVFIFNKKKTKERITLSATKHEFAKQCEQFVNGGEMKIIPSLMFGDDSYWSEHSYWIEYLLIIEYHKDVHIGISFKYNSIDNTVIPTGIHLDKDSILKQHQLGFPNHYCQCLNNFRTNVHDFRIGNPDDLQNRINCQKNEIEFWKSRANNKQPQNDINNVSPKEALRNWLKYEVGLEQCFDALLQDGWDSLDGLQFLQPIHLDKIGITKTGYQMKLLGKIKELTKRQPRSMNRVNAKPQQPNQNHTQSRYAPRRSKPSKSSTNHTQHSHIKPPSQPQQPLNLIPNHSVQCTPLAGEHPSNKHKTKTQNKIPKQQNQQQQNGSGECHAIYPKIQSRSINPSSIIYHHNRTGSNRSRGRNAVARTYQQTHTRQHQPADSYPHHNTQQPYKQHHQSRNTQPTAKNKGKGYIRKHRPHRGNR